MANTDKKWKKHQKLMGKKKLSVRAHRRLRDSMLLKLKHRYNHTEIWRMLVLTFMEGYDRGKHGFPEKKLRLVAEDFAASMLIFRET